MKKCDRSCKKAGSAQSMATGGMRRTYRWISGGLVGPSLSLVVKLVQCRGEPVRVLLAQIIDRGELGVRKGAQVAQGQR